MLVTWKEQRRNKSKQGSAWAVISQTLSSDTLWEDSGPIPLDDYKTWEFEHKDIIKAYLAGEISSTEAIWIAMNRASQDTNTTERATPAQVEAGRHTEYSLFDASYRREMEGLGGSEPLGDTSTWEYENPDLIQMYLNDEIEHAEALWIAMSRAV